MATKKLQSISIKIILVRPWIHTAGNSRVIEDQIEPLLGLPKAEEIFILKLYACITGQL